ncbi:TetR/AcrR family transcriptional regulator [Avibacterium sp. 20-126]|uniref:TetR/AcrR family transcriptional regulator n=1 Tax=Avibacterium sp. 20-126 TaxID=2911524 RepID=UPI00218BAFAC|nr:TetR/AcrR family transcriptional regulator [Avibacterium sp. 20-126]
MTQKTDLRVLRTHKLIRNALIELLEHKTFDKISVQDIVDTAMINRATFYKYYSGKSDLAGKMIAEVKAEYQKLMAILFYDITAQEKSAQLTEERITFFAKMRPILPALFKIKTKRHHLYDDIFLSVKHTFIELAKQKNPKQDWDYHGEMFAHLLLHSVKRQLASGKLMPPAQMIGEWEAMLSVIKDLHPMGQNKPK